MGFCLLEISKAEILWPLVIKQGKVIRCILDACFWNFVPITFSNGTSSFGRSLKGQGIHKLNRLVDRPRRINRSSGSEALLVGWLKIVLKSPPHPAFYEHNKVTSFHLVRHKVVSPCASASNKVPLEFRSLNNDHSPNNSWTVWRVLDCNSFNPKRVV